MTALFALVLAAALVVAAASAGTAGKIIDRTFVCTPVATYGGMRDISVTAAPPYKDPQEPEPAMLLVKSGPYSPYEQLVAVRTKAAQRFGSNQYRAGVYANTARCQLSRASVPLSPKGLPSPPVLWSKEVDCKVRGRVLVHVRAELDSPSAWRPTGAPYAGAVGTVASAQIAVRSEKTGKPIGFATLGQDGKTKLWTKSGCS